MVRVSPAKFQERTGTYKCVICGWDGFPDVTGGWCMTEEIPCPECGPDVLVEEDEDSVYRPSIPKGHYELW